MWGKATMSSAAQRVLDAEAVEALALSAGFLGLVAGIKILIATVVLGSGAGGMRHALLLFAWVAMAILRCYQHRACEID
jgi:hypothetical protein